MNKSTTHYVLWTLQIVLALLFTFAGVAKLVIPVADMQQSGIPGVLLRIVAVAELLGACGLVLPGLFRIRTGLTPLAAVGLIIIMIGATVTMFRTMGPVPSAFPFATGLLLIFVIYGRLRLAPLPQRG